MKFRDVGNCDRMFKCKISYFMCENLIYYNLTFEKSLSKKRQINQLEYFVKCVFLRFGHPDPEGSGPSKSTRLYTNALLPP